MPSATVRYFVNELDESVRFYVEHLEFTEELRPAVGLAILSNADLRLLLTVPGGPGAGARLADGELPQPGGWNRFAVEVSDLASTIDTLRGRGAQFRGDLITNAGFQQILLKDPSGNLIELFQAPAG